VLRSDAATRGADLVSARDLDDASGGRLLANLNASRSRRYSHRRLEPCRLDTASFINGESTSERAAVGERLNRRLIKEARGEAKRCAQLRFAVQVCCAARRTGKLKVPRVAPVRVNACAADQALWARCGELLDATHSGA
jgi:hypothetical protein